MQSQHTTSIKFHQSTQNFYPSPNPFPTINSPLFPPLGTCKRGQKKPFCQCREGFRGRRCELDHCGCLHGATCVSRKAEDGINYSCRCPPQYSGTHCETYDPMSCRDVACRNGGTCVMAKGIPSCKWVDGSHRGVLMLWGMRKIADLYVCTALIRL